MKIQIEIEIPNIPEETLIEILGNILEHIDSENKYWRNEEMIGEDDFISGRILDRKLSTKVESNIGWF